MNGYLALVLHAHLPFVRHPEHEEFLEEDWLYEAITETYLPLLEVFERLAGDGVPFRLTLSLTPTLISMLRDPLLMSRYARRLDRLVELADQEVRRTLSFVTADHVDKILDAALNRRLFEAAREELEPADRLMVTPEENTVSQTVNIRQ